MRKLTNSSLNLSQLNDTKLETIYNKLKENNYEIIKNSFFFAEKEISSGNFDVKFSGSTCILVFCLGNKIISANAGDSRSIMVGEITKNKNNFISKIKLLIFFIIFLGN
jgi:serine/threonine protein phosphatase PrpC